MYPYTTEGLRIKLQNTTTALETVQTMSIPNMDWVYF